jgi:hypothetical protein
MGINSPAGPKSVGTFVCALDKTTWTEYISYLTEHLLNLVRTI